MWFLVLGCVLNRVGQSGPEALRVEMAEHDRRLAETSLVQRSLATAKRSRGVTVLAPMRTMYDGLFDAETALLFPRDDADALALRIDQILHLADVRPGRENPLGARHQHHADGGVRVEFLQSLEQ